MTKLTRDLASIATAVLLLLVSTAASATFSGGVTIAPASTKAAIGRSSSVTIRWSATTNDGPFVQSTTGTFRIPNGSTLGIVSRTLTTSAVSVPVTVTLNEQLLIPSNVIFAAFKAGVSRIEYVRDFEDGDGPFAAVQGVFLIDLTSPSAAAFGIGRLALSFEDGAIEKIAEEEQFLRAKADISHTGSGVIRGVWEAADPTSTAGTPIYRPLTQVREFLSAGGDKTLFSPRLPTSSTGLHLVRFRLTDPALFDTDPVIRYFVQPRPAPLEPIGLVMPPHLSLLGNDTRFTWQPIAGVRAYQLELFEQGLPIELPADTAPVDEPRAIDPRPGSSISPTTGLLVPGDQSAVPLTTLARTHLMSGRTYLWRVLAIGSEGTVIGESPLRAIRVP